MLTILNILDAVSTWKVVKIGNNKNEKNPLARMLFNLIGPIPAMIILKGIAILIIAYIMLNFKKFKPEVDTFMIILNLIYLWIVIHNFHVLKRMNCYLRSDYNGKYQKRSYSG
jgi:uncharacterized membrane protein